MPRIIAALHPLLVAGCAADRYTNKEMTKYDENTEYRVEEQEDGFTLYFWYERFIAFGSQKQTAELGKAKLLNIAYELADERRKEIKTVNEQRIKSNTGKTFWDISSWSAMVKVFWKK